MDNNIIQFVGGPCGQHGPYTFYKAFKYKKNGQMKIVTLSEFFFVKLWIDSDLLCIGELQLLWIDKNSDQVLASLRLYFLPENTPEGRMDHGEDEVLAIAEKVVLRVEDLVTWITVDAEWTWGRLGKCDKQIKEPPDEDKRAEIIPISLSESSLDFSDVEKEKKCLGNDDQIEDEDDIIIKPSVVILSYPRYCRYRAMMRRLEGVENEYLKYNIVKALGGFSFKGKNTRVMFCRDTFEYPELEGHEMLCNHLAPKLKGRPRGKRKKRSISPGSESNESECSVSTSFNIKTRISSESGSSRNGIYIDGSLPRRSTRSSDNSDTKEFIKKLTAFMKMKRTPLGRTPCLGCKEIDLYEFYSKVQRLGGYDAVTSNKLWKSIFDDLSGHQPSTGAATIIRRHYERFLLSYERHMRGEEYKPLPISERRRLKTKSCSSKRESESSEEASTGSENNTPISSVTFNNAPSGSESPVDNKDMTLSLKQECKTSSSLRSVRVKPERQKEKFAKVVKMEDITSSTENLNTMKIEIKTEDEERVVIKQENLVVIPELPSIEIENITIKKEPVTSAVAPVVQKLEQPEKTPSPFECKENIPIIETGNTASTNKEIIINVPCNQKSMEELEKNLNNLEESKSKLTDTENSNFVEEFKKEKLDILKEGGLEVTPVHTSSPLTKDLRPSVIQNISNPKAFSTEIYQMPPPNQPISINVPQCLNISKVPHTPTKSNNGKYPVNNFPFPKAPSTPPKVVQSRSIYSYSEKTVYGNPKDFLMNSYPVHTPKPVNLKKQTGGDLLDLSPQKSFVEMRIPMIPSTAHSSNCTNTLTPRNPTKTANLPIFEGRKLGSNLEITLIDSTGKTTPYSKAPHIQNAQQYVYNKSHQKRTISESSNLHHKMPRLEENGKHNRPSTSNYGRDRLPQNNISLPIPHHPYPTYKPPKPEAKPYPEQIQNPKNYPPGVPYPHYLSQFYEGNKAIPPSYFPMIDPLFYSAAMQSLYPQTPINHPPQSYLQYATQEQLKMYNELMAQNSRIPFPYQMPSKDSEYSNYKKS